MESSSGVEDVVKGETFTVYPNPTNGYTTIAFNEPAIFKFARFIRWMAALCANGH